MSEQPKFKVNQLYRVDTEIVSILLDPQNPEEPHPLFKEDAEKAVLKQGVEFFVTKELEVEEKDEWPKITDSGDDVEMEKVDSYTLEALIPSQEQMAVLFLQSGMLARNEIVEVNS